jgi:hypothetical protein
MRIAEAGYRATLLAGIFATVLVGAVARCWSADSSDAPDPLLDLLIQKGILTQQEADRVQAEAAVMRSNNAAQMPAMPPSKWKISEGISNIELFGNARLRYEDRYAEDPGGSSIDLRRWRYALELGLRGDLFSQFYYGVRLDTGTSPRSQSVTFGTSASSGPYQGPFGRSNDGVDIGELYFGWRPWEGVNLTVGRMDNPLYTTPMVWSPAITPEGFAERFNYDVGPAQFFANFGQFLYANNYDSASPGLGLGFAPGSSGPGGGQNTDNIFMFAWQGGFTYHLTTNVSAKVAATVYNYTGLQASSGTTAESPYFGDPYVGEGAYYYYGGAARGYAPGYSGYSPGATFQGGSTTGGFSSLSYPFNQVGLNNLLVLEIPFELNFKIDRLDARVFGDFAYNLQGAQRAEDAASAYKSILSTLASAPGSQTVATNFPAQSRDVKAYQIGVALASPGCLGMVYSTTSRKHGWEVRTYWQHTEQYALDPNLPDVDFFEGAQNMQGIYVAVAYGLTDNLIATFRYGHASRINDVLGTGGSDTGDIPQINPIKDYDIYQMDLTLRF